MSFYNDDASRYKRRRVVKNRVGSSRRRTTDIEQTPNEANEDGDQNGNNNELLSNEKTNMTVSTPDVLKEKPVWMSDAEWAIQQASVKRAIEPLVQGDNDDKEVDKMAYEDINVKMKYLKDIKDSGKDEIVKEYYNTQTFHSRQSKRTESPIYRLRSFNNCIKYILINKYGIPEGSTLDLGCGKGGDLAKWGMNNTRQYVGIDLSDESIREAIKRYKNGRYSFQAVFATGDAFKVELPEILKDFSMEQVSFLQFDNISMQFCMHYAFSSEASVESMLNNVSKSLRVGGMFVGTIPSSDFIKWKINKMKEGGKGWGNSLYSVTFPDLEGCWDREKKNFKKPFGNVYNYFLKDAVEDVPEYVVPFEKFRSMCEDHGLELRYKKNFFDMFNKEIATFFPMLPGPLVQSLRQEDGTYGVSGEEREACSFYLSFAFERV